MILYFRQIFPNIPLAAFDIVHPLICMILYFLKKIYLMSLELGGLTAFDNVHPGIRMILLDLNEPRVESPAPLSSVHKGL